MQACLARFQLALYGAGQAALQAFDALAFCPVQPGHVLAGQPTAELAKLALLLAQRELHGAR